MSHWRNEGPLCSRRRGRERRLVCCHKRVVDQCDDSRMDTWGSSRYGNPCRECGFGWQTALDDAISLISDVPSSYERTLEGATGVEQHPDLGWSVGAYVCHVADNLRIWAERLAGVTAGASGVIEAYEPDLLAIARAYAKLPLVAAEWSLHRAVADWLDAVARSRLEGVLLIHPERGALTLEDVACANAHDALHHLWDIQRSLDAAGNERERSM